MINIIGLGLYGYMSGSGPGRKLSTIPGRLMVRSAGDIFLLNDIDIFGIRGHEISAGMDEDFLAVFSDGAPCVEDGMADVRLVSDSDIVISRKEIYAEVTSDGMTITYSGNASMRSHSDGFMIETDWNPGTDEYAYARITGTMERSKPAEDYLASRKELYGEFLDDGLLICYAGEAEFELEKIRIGG